MDVMLDMSPISMLSFELHAGWSLASVVFSEKSQSVGRVWGAAKYGLNIYITSTALYMGRIVVRSVIGFLV